MLLVHLCTDSDADVRLNIVIMHAVLIASYDTLVTVIVIFDEKHECLSRLLLNQRRF